MLLATIELQEIPSVVLATSALLALATVLAVITQRLRVPLTVILVAVGFVAGEVARANGIALPIEGEAFHEVLVFVFLPVLVFEAALTLPARIFARNLVPILTLAVVALVIAATLVGVAVHVGLGVSLVSALLFGALIAATDPVAVTATFRDLGVPSRLLVLVEGESLFNDAIAIVLFNILLVAALGTESVGVLDGVLDFLYVFLGGAALGAGLGLGVAELARRLGRVPSTAMTIALAYGAFALGEQIFGFSGVMASVAAGLVLSALSRTLIPSEEVETWHAVWHSIGFVANGLLFLLIGVVIEAGLIVDNLGSIAIGIAAVVVSRPLAIFPLMPVVTRLARLPAVGLRNEAVLVWGGLRGGVALALALAIPGELPDQERFVAMTAGVVLATLVLNATTIRALVQRLGLDRPPRVDRFVAAAARFDGAHAARKELRDLIGGTEIDAELAEVESAAAAEIERLELSDEELHQALMRRGLAVERASLQELVDEGLVPQWHGRVALGALEDQLEELGVGRSTERGLFQAKGFGRIVYEVARRIHVGRMTPAKWVEIAFRDVHARAKASHDAIAALERFAPCPGIGREALHAVVERFRGWHDHARATLDHLVEVSPPELVAPARRRYSAELATLAAGRELRQLTALGLCSPAASERAQKLIASHLERTRRQRLEVAVDPDEDIGA